MLLSRGFMEDDGKTADEFSYELAYLRVLVSDLEHKNRQTEELLRVVTEQYRRITEVVSDYIFSVHVVDGNPLETVHGRGCFAITGYSPEEFASNNFLWINMVFEDDRALVLMHVAGILSGKDTAPFEHRIVRKDGAVRWVRNTPVCQYDKEGKLIAYDGLIQDVTERRQAEEALQKSEEKYRIIADFTYDWEEWIGPDGHYLYVSPSCERITGYRPEEFIANPHLVIIITHPADQDMVAAHYNAALKGNREARHLDFRIITRGGEERWISHSCQHVFGEDGRWLGKRASNRDISKHRKLTEDPMKGRELEAVGILAGGIAHDFNNLMTAILGNISVAKRYAQPGDKIFKFLANAEDASVRSSDLIKQLNMFSKRAAPVKKRLALGEMLKQITLSAVGSGAIEHELSIPEDLWPVEADEGQIDQVISSIILNAKEAMGDSGLLTVSAVNTTVRDNDNLTIKSGDYARISIKDTGVGIPVENTTKIFDPYFTTKDVGAVKGIGLGLAMAYSIIANHDGVITVESEVGKGTTFHIYLPAAQ